jgi:hypothetical protein
MRLRFTDLQENVFSNFSYLKSKYHIFINMFETIEGDSFQIYKAGISSSNGKLMFQFGIQATVVLKLWDTAVTRQEQVSIRFSLIPTPKRYSVKNTLRARPCVYDLPRKQATHMTRGYFWNTVLQQWEPRSL